MSVAAVDSGVRRRKVSSAGTAVRVSRRACSAESELDAGGGGDGGGAFALGLGLGLGFERDVGPTGGAPMEGSW